MLSRWVLASLAVLGRLHWVDKEKLTNFILACQVDVITETPTLANNTSSACMAFYICSLK